MYLVAASEGTGAPGGTGDSRRPFCRFPFHRVLEGSSSEARGKSWQQGAGCCPSAIGPGILPTGETPCCHFLLSTPGSQSSFLHLSLAGDRG